MATVLLVDDDYESLGALQVALEAVGHYVLLAENGEAALHAASRYLPDLIVTDWNMPVMDGRELCVRLKYYPSLAHIPIVMLSATSPPSGLQLQCDVFLRKPVRIEELASVASTFLAQRVGSTGSNRSVHANLASARWTAINWRCWP
jgi:CheY-like chemotaxis protein